MLFTDQKPKLGAHKFTPTTVYFNGRNIDECEAYPSGVLVESIATTGEETPTRQEYEPVPHCYAAFQLAPHVRSIFAVILCKSRRLRHGGNKGAGKKSKGAHTPSFR